MAYFGRHRTIAAVRGQAGRMPKSIYQDEYDVFRAYLRGTRRAAGLTQVQLAERLHGTQTFVSKVERGERRLDVVELRAFCRAMEVPFGEFVSGLEAKLDRADR